MPLPYLSSANAGWEGLVAFALLEPRTLEGLLTPVFPALSLVFFRGGALRMEVREANGPWSRAYMRAGSVSVRAAWGPPLEVRWRSATAAPTSTLHVHLGQTLVHSVAEQIPGYDLARLDEMECPCLHDTAVVEVGHALWRELERPSPAGALYASTAAQFLAAHLLCSSPAAGAARREPEPGELSPLQAQQVVDFVQAHLDQPLSLAALAQHTGFSAYHFARLFRRTLGESPHQFVLRLRVERAQELLRRSELSLAEVALATGFAHQSHLTQLFKRQVGVTPSVYRREHAPRMYRQADVEV
jgi:AraC family transcriptional regulator